MWTVKKAQGKIGKYLINEETGVKKYFDLVLKPCYGMYLVMKDINGDHQYFDSKRGRLSETFVCAENYSDGYALVSKNDINIKQFRDLKGHLSETYVMASSYSNGYALVKRTDDSLYRYRDINGKLSDDEYELAYPYHNGLARVRNSNGFWQFRDTDGHLSQEYFYAKDNTMTGFAAVKVSESSKTMWRDMLGNLSEKDTQFGRDLADYMLFERKSIYQLCDECFGSDEFINIMLKKEQSNFERALEMCSNQEDIDKLHEVASDIFEYIHTKAYEAKNKNLNVVNKEQVKQLAEQQLEKD